MATLPAAVVVPLGLLFFLSGLIVNAIQATCRINCQVAELLWLELVFLVDWWARVQNVVLLVHFLTGLILMVISFIMGVIETTTSLNSHLKVIFRLSAVFCFADGLALLRQGMKDKSSSGVLD